MVIVVCTNTQVIYNVYHTDITKLQCDKNSLIKWCPHVYVSATPDYELVSTREFPQCLPLTEIFMAPGSFFTNVTVLGDLVKGFSIGA